LQRFGTVQPAVPMKMFMKCGVVLLVAVKTPTLFAQSAPRERCWRSPSPACQTIFLTEVGYQHAFFTNTRAVMDRTGTVSERSRAFGEHLSWELGVLTRVQSRRAVGAAVAVGASETGLRAALKVRGRQFVGERSSVELSAGFLTASVGTFIEHPRSSGFTTDARFNVEDLISVVVTYDDVTWPPATSDVFEYLDDTSRARAFKAGVSAGSWAGVGASVVIGVLFGLFAWAYTAAT
jgi:hypothetical protein